MDIRSEQKVVVYENGGMVYSGSWENASDEIKNAGGDWYLLDASEDMDIILILA